MSQMPVKFSFVFLTAWDSFALGFNISRRGLALDLGFHVVDIQWERHRGNVQEVSPLCYSDRHGEENRPGVHRPRHHRAD